MSTFALDKNYNPLNFEEISVAELEVISGGSGGGTIPGYPFIPVVYGGSVFSSSGSGGSGSSGGGGGGGGGGGWVAASGIYA